MIKKLITYYCFIVVTATVLLGFLNASSYPQLLSAVMFFPLAAYFWFTVVPKKSKALALPEIPSEKLSTAKLIKEESSGKKIDIDRRAFLKLISSAGVSIFLLSILTKKAHGAFFGSVPGPGTISLKDSSGNVIDPAIKGPTDGYKISRLDDSAPAYYGFTNKDGAWFIMKEAADGSYTYAVGSSDFSGNWAVHDQAPPAGPTYGEFADQF